MRIYLEQLANEALGIPEGILETTDVIYEEMMNEWAEDMKKKYKYSNVLGKGGSITLNLQGPYTIKDETWDNVELLIDIKTFKKNNSRLDPIFAGAGFSFQSSLDKNFKRYETVPNNTIPLTLSFVFNEDNTWEDAYDLVNTKLENKVKETLAHELKHAFDSRKKQNQKFTSRARYATSTQQTPAQPLNKFNYKVYYTHYIENLVRPVEFAKYLQRKNVTKQEFLKELKNSDIYKMLNETKNFSYDKLIQDITEDFSAMRAAAQIAHNNGKDIDSLDEIQLAEILLEFNYEKIIEAQKEDYLNAVSDTFSEFSRFLGGNYGDPNSDKAKAVKEIMEDIDRFGKNYKAFYKYEIKKMNMLAEKTLRKLAKLYAYIQ
jgi:hypothetical protein